jgi:integral membrane protein
VTNLFAISPRTAFLIFARAEAVTWALLLTGITLRATLPEPPVWLLGVAGSVHGAVFLGYAMVAALVGVNQRWGFGQIVLAVALAIVPFATIPFEIRLDRRGKLAGNWRKTALDAPERDNWFDRLFRWFVARPALLALVFTVLGSTIFAVLLSLGSPTQWGRD